MCSNHTFSITQSRVKQKSEHSTDSLMKAGSEKNTTLCCLELKYLFALLDHNVSFSKVRLDLKHDMNSSQTQLHNVDYAITEHPIISLSHTNKHPCRYRKMLWFFVKKKG